MKTRYLVPKKIPSEYTTQIILFPYSFTNVSVIGRNKKIARGNGFCQN